MKRDDAVPNCRQSEHTAKLSAMRTCLELRRLAKQDKLAVKVQLEMLDTATD